MASHLEEQIGALLLGAEPSLPVPVREYEFHPTRRWRFDFAWPTWKVAAEVEGGLYAKRKTRHVHAAGFREDCRKYNSAATLGWLVLRFSEKDLKDGGYRAAGFRGVDVIQCTALQEIRAALKARGAL